jgi:hypothetical protein
MRLIHHDKEIITFDPNRVYPKRDQDAYFKPNGLWVSDEDDFGWSHWCTGEQWGTDGLVYEHLVELHPNHNVLFIRTVEEIDKFHEEYSVDILKDRQYRYPSRRDWCDWSRVYPLWQGLIISPYLWERRMQYMWYYGWDCASGCIWDLSAIARFTPVLKQLTWGGGKNV